MRTDDWDLSELHEKSNPNFLKLGILGPAGSGKDLAADWFCNEKNFVKVAFADPIKRFARKAFFFSYEQLWGPSEERNREFVVDDAWWFEAIGHFGEASKEIVENILDAGNRVEGYLKLHDWLTQLRKDYREKISARVVLQTLGTEWGRSVDDLLWAKYAHRVIARIAQGHAYSQDKGIRDRRPGEVSAYAGAIIPDHRFKNEVTTTQEQGGYVLRLRRLALEKKDETVGISGHRSEAEQKTIPDNTFNLVIEFEEGVEMVYKTLEKVYVEKSWTVKEVQPRS